MTTEGKNVAAITALQAAYRGARSQKQQHEHEAFMAFGRVQEARAGISQAEATMARDCGGVAQLGR